MEKRQRNRVKLSPEGYGDSQVLSSAVKSYFGGNSFISGTAMKGRLRYSSWKSRP